MKRPERSQVQWRPLALDELVAEDHRARIVWQYVQTLDLERLYAGIRAVEGEPGRDAVDPRLLLGLWLLATLEGVGSARQLDRLCERDLAYLWMCGGVTVNYHLLADFRTAHAEFLDELLTRSVAALMHQGLVTLERVAQDGMKVRPQRRQLVVPPPRDAREMSGRGRNAPQSPAPGAGRGRRGERPPPRSGPTPRRRGAHAADRAGAAGTRRTAAAAPEEEAERAALVDHRSGSAADEDGRRRLPPGV